MTVKIHSYNFNPGGRWEKQASDLVGFAKYRQEMPKDVYNRLRAKIIALSLITLGGYYIYLNCTKKGKELLHNLKEKSIIHYVADPSEKSGSQKTAAKTDFKAKGIQPSGKTSEVKTYQATFNKTKVVVARGDITKEPVDAIVNAANSIMLGGGGVDGAIHRAAGPKLLAECEKVEPDEKGNRCLMGEAVITGAGNLPAKYVIHTVGPKDTTPNRAKFLRDAHFNSLSLAAANNLQTVTFPAISIGIFNYPLEEAAPIAIRAVREFAEENNQIKEVRFVIFIPGAEKDPKAKLLEDSILQAFGKALEAESSKPFEKKPSANEDYQKIFNDAIAKAGITGGSARYLEDFFKFKLEKEAFQGEGLQNKAGKLKFKEEFLDEIQEAFGGLSFDPDCIAFSQNFENIGFESLNKILDKALGIIPKKVGFNDTVTVHGVEGETDSIAYVAKDDTKIMKDLKNQGIKMKPLGSDPYAQWIKEATNKFVEKLEELGLSERVIEEFSIEFRSALNYALDRTEAGDQDRLVFSTRAWFKHYVEGFVDDARDLPSEDEIKMRNIQYTFEDNKNEINAIIEETINETRPNTWGA